MKALLPLAALALAACATTSGAAPRSPTAGFGETVVVAGLTVTPTRLIEDSRCPTNVRCVWAGRVVIEARIAGRGWRETARMTLSEPFATHGRALALATVGPDKIAGAAVPPRDYRFTFEPR